MDRNQVIGLVLISAILIGYLQFFAPEPVEELAQENQTEKVDSTEKLSSEIEIEEQDLADAEVNDSLLQIQNDSKYGVFAAVATGDDEVFEIENNVSKFTFSSKGGVLQQVELKDYKTYSGEPLFLLDSDSHKEELSVQLNDGKSININDLYFTITNSFTSFDGKDSVNLLYEANLGGGKVVQKKYTVYSGKYEVKSSVNFKKLSSDVDLANAEVIITDKGRHVEKDMTQSRHRSMVTYMTSEEDFDDFGERSMDDFSENLENVKWFSFKQKFFSKVYIFDNPLKTVNIKLSTDESDMIFTKYYESNYKVDLSKGLNNTIYYGPNKYSILSDVGFDLEKNVYLGWSLFRVINEYLILPLFNFINSLFGSMGLVIFLLVLVIKMAIFPFTFKSYKGFAKMRVLKPELDSLKEKCGDDQTKYQQEQMKVYQKFGVSPLSGCIPMLFQMPFLFALFQLFPNSIELRGKSFLWAEDLSSYDAFFSWEASIPFLGNHISLFTLMMTLSTIAYTYISQQMTPTATAPGQPNMKVMSYMMPLVFFFVLNDYASGLTYYYFLSNLITISQQLISKKFIDEEKILAKMHDYSKKDNKKKSSFSRRLEEAMKAQQEKQKKK